MAACLYRTEYTNATTTTLDRDRTRQGYSGDVHVSYNWTNLRKRLMDSTYACNSNKCPHMRERREQHQKSHCSTSRYNERASGSDQIIELSTATPSSGGLTKDDSDADCRCTKTTRCPYQRNMDSISSVTDSKIAVKGTGTTFQEPLASSTRTESKYFGKPSRIPTLQTTSNNTSRREINQKTIDDRRKMASRSVRYNAPVINEADDDDDYVDSSDTLTNNSQTNNIETCFKKFKQQEKKTTSTTTTEDLPWDLKTYKDNYTSSDDVDNKSLILYGNITKPMKYSNSSYEASTKTYNEDSYIDKKSQSADSKQSPAVTKGTSTKVPNKSTKRPANSKNNIVRKNSNSKHVNRKKSNTLEINQANKRPKRIKSQSKDFHVFQEAVTEWIKEIPMFSSLEIEEKQKNDKVVSILINQIENIPVEAVDYESQIKIKAEDCLQNLPIWYPGAKREQAIFKKKLIDKLLKRIINVNPNISNGKTTDQIKKTVVEWLIKMYDVNKSESNGTTNDISEVADFVIQRIMPKLNGVDNNSVNCNEELKSAAFKITRELPINTINFKNNRSQVQQFADDLVRRLQRLIPKGENRIVRANVSTALLDMGFTDSFQKECEICKEVRNYFLEENVHCPSMTIQETGYILKEFLKMPDPEGEIYSRNNIVDLLIASTNIEEPQASIIAKKLTKRVTNILGKDLVNVVSYYCNKSRQPNTMSVYSIEESSSLNYPITSSPKNKPTKKSIPKLNPQEVEYMNNVAKLIRVWMNTLPESFDAPEEKIFKETMIKDLAGDIMDEEKIEQLYPGARGDRKKYQDYIVARWVHRLGVIEIEEVEPQIQEFIQKFKDIPVPDMTQPQHGNRQDMHNIKHIYGDQWRDTFQPKGLDILEDEISIWMDEQPSEIFTCEDRNFRNRKINELAQILENKLSNKHSLSEVKTEVAQWLDNILNPLEKQELENLAEDLNDRLAGLPQDATLTAKRKKRANDIAELIKTKTASHEQPPIEIIERSDNETVNQDRTMKMFISNYLNQNCSTDDPLARQAFGRILKIHLQRLDTPTKKEVYDKSGKDEKWLSLTLIKELEYIKYISDWLKNLPLQPYFNTVDNRERVDILNSLAMNIREIEEDREKNPNAMDYDFYMEHTILAVLSALPIIPEYRNIQNLNFMLEQLLRKIFSHRKDVNDKVNESINTTGVNYDNLGEFIEEFIVLHGDDIAQDEVKLEAWATRLIKEIKRILRDTTEPALSNDKIYNMLTSGEEKAVVFMQELEYIKEITNWLKNFPLLPMNDFEQASMISNICDLAEKITEIELNRTNNPMDTKVDAEFNEYVTKWISKLPLDNNKNFVYSIIIQQLLNRINKAKRKGELQLSTISHSDKSIQKTLGRNNKNKRFSNESHKNNSKLCIVDVIENWSNKLIFDDQGYNATDMKTEVARKLYKCVAQLNSEPRVYNDDLLYKDMLSVEIENIIDSLPQTDTLFKNKDNIKKKLIQDLMDAKMAVKEITAGHIYKLKLQNILDASIPYPKSVDYIYDPGFEIYKRYLATKFILDNFDYGAAAVKAKYDNLITKKLDRYFNHAKNRNSRPIAQNELNNELYSALFKIPSPNEASMIIKVEELKTMCEINDWFEKLPLREPQGIDDLLESDNIIETLAIKIHEIETAGTKTNEKLLNEITKCLTQLPLLPQYNNNHEEYAKYLQNILKNTENDRKCVLNIKSSKSKKSQMIAKSKDFSKALEKTSQNNRLNDSSTSQSQPKHTQTSIPKKNATDEIFKIVQSWCKQIPIPVITPSDQENAQILRDNLATNILVKISDLNMKLNVLKDDFQYDILLDEELEALLTSIPTCCDFEKSKQARKEQLKEAIKAIKPLIIKERAYQIYKHNLSTTVNKILKMPLDMPASKKASFLELRNGIVEDFIQTMYAVGDKESAQLYKSNILANVSQISNLVDKDNKKSPLITTNLLVCELQKIPIGNEINLRHELEEIRMKNELTDLFHQLGLPSKDKNKTNHLKRSLSQKLNEIELNGHSLENSNKMKQEITKCLHRLEKKVNPQVIDDFVQRLRDNEAERRSAPILNEENVNAFQNICCNNNLNEVAFDIFIDAHKSKPGTTRDLDTVTKKNTQFKSASNEDDYDNDAMEISESEEITETSENEMDQNCPLRKKCQRFRFPYHMPFRCLHPGFIYPFWCRMPPRFYY